MLYMIKLSEYFYFARQQTINCSRSKLRYKSGSTRFGQDVYKIGHNSSKDYESVD